MRGCLSGFASSWSVWLILICGISLSQQLCTEFVEIPKEDYDRTYHTIQEGDSGARPLGFIKSTLMYQGNVSKPCFTIKGIVGQSLEIKYETVPNMKLCVQQKDADYETCADVGRFGDCVTLSQESTDFEFFCDISTGCAEGDVNFWARFTKGPDPANDTENMWCHELQELYPESLRPLPSVFTPPPTEPAIDGATCTTLSVNTSILCVLLSTLIMPPLIGRLGALY